MIVSWHWLQEYVSADVPLSAVLERLTMAGLNVDSQHAVGDDTAVDVEVTSNRPDCLGHIGIAREVAVLFRKELHLPPAEPAIAAGHKTADVTSVAIECPELCPQYFARVIRGVKVGPSPVWLRQRLESVGLASINNIVDVTNYVLLECGQPLHAFDFDKLHGQRIVVRQARRGEKIVAINQKAYELEPSMCVIADTDRPVALGGVMGGWDTEIGPSTRNVLIETANFVPMSIRGTARKLGLHSDSSYRFERGIDPTQLDWASRRCCQLILETAGGELLDEPIQAGQPIEKVRLPISLRFAQIPRILGIEVPREEAVPILKSLGIEPKDSATNGSAAFVPPSWRRDVSREIDLVEEIARIHGYDKIPQDVPVPLHLSGKTLRDRVCERIRGALTAAGFFEAVTLSFVSEEANGLFRPRGTVEPLRVEHSSRRHENVLRQSVIPSLLVSRQINERHGTANAQLFEIAKVYLQTDFRQPESAREPTVIALVSGRSFIEMKGVVETLACQICSRAQLNFRPSTVRQFAEGRAAEVLLNGTLWGWLGELDRSFSDGLDLEDAVTVAELDLSLLEANAELIAAYEPLAQFPAIERDLNFVLDEETTWESLESVVRKAAGPFLEQVGFGGQYRGKQIDAGKKSYVVTLTYRATDRTLTADEVDAAQKSVIQACAAMLGARLR